MNTLETKDLVPGSLVLWESKPCLVTEIDGIEHVVVLRDAYTFESHGSVDLSGVLHIPLSAEWLEKFGFKKHSFDGYDRYNRTLTSELAVYHAHGLHSWDWRLQQGSTTLTQLFTVHHLQCLFWNLERVWISHHNPASSST